MYIYDIYIYMIYIYIYDIYIYIIYIYIIYIYTHITCTTLYRSDLYAIYLIWRYQKVVFFFYWSNVQPLKCRNRTQWAVASTASSNVNPGLINPKRLFNWEGTMYVPYKVTIWRVPPN